MKARARATRRDFLKGSLALVAGSVAIEACGGATAGNGGAEAQDAEAPDGGAPDGGAPDGGAPDAAAPDGGSSVPLRPDTTVRWRIQGVLPSEPQPESEKRYWGVTRLAPGEAHQRIDLLNADPTATAAYGEAASLLYMAQLTDIHVMDEESPARAGGLDLLADGAWRAQEAYTAQVLDAMVRRINALNAVRPFDFLLITGDLIDNNQKNELEWFLQVLRGGLLQPNSGALEDPIQGPENDPHDVMRAEGLQAIPWYVAIGNHDLLVQGILTKGPFVPYSLLTGDPTRTAVEWTDLGRANPPMCNPLSPDEAQAPARCLPTPWSALTSGTIPGDPDRANLSTGGLFSAIAGAPGLPSGHGFGTTLSSTPDGDYVVQPKADLPLRLVVLNTVGGDLSEGALAQEKIDGFLDAALKEAEASRALVIVSSHHPSDSIAATGAALRARLNACPNVVLHLVGHTHKNLVQPRPGDDPQHGYWEVTTASLVDWPQQSRLVELVDCRNGILEVWLTMVDLPTEHRPLGSLVEASRFLALQEVHSGALGSGTASEGRAIDRNVILPVALTPELRARLATATGKPIESKLFA
jgi:3',5'-cyclic AMP phosphodiesterase CpdA